MFIYIHINRKEQNYCSHVYVCFFFMAFLCCVEVGKSKIQREVYTPKEVGQ